MSARVLITGASGFAGRHLVAELGTVSLTRVDRSSGTDLRDPDATLHAVRDARPDLVFHLAALASVGRSWESPGETLAANTQMTLNLLEAVRREASEARVLVTSSGEVYGPPRKLPVEEAAPLRPQNPYAVSKAQADLLAGFYADAHGLHVVRARAFNHAGAGQPADYALSSFAKQAAEGAEVIRTGRLDTRRDFLDVHDVVRAYRLLAEHGAAGEAYNVCSGRSVATGELVELVARAAGRELPTVQDPARVRAHEVLDLYGDRSKLTAATGWEPEIPLSQTAKDAYQWWQSSL